MRFGIACFMCGISGCSTAPRSDVGASSALVSPFATEMASLGPIGWWRLGELSGVTAADSGSGNHPGSYINFASGQHAVAGAIPGDADGAIAISPTTGNYVEVGNQDAFSLSKANDSFDRTLANGWGTADHGGAWTPEVTTTTTYYSTDGSHAAITESVSGTWQIGLEDVQRADADIQVRASWNQAPSATDPTIAPLAIIARRSRDNSNSYRAELQEDHSGALSLRFVKVVAGMSSPIGTPISLGATYAVNTWWYVRFQLAGPTLRARAWRSTDPEPTGWTITVTDSAISGPGSVSIRSTNSGASARPIVLFEGLRIQSVGMTVHGFMKPTVPDFNAGNYIYWLGKGATPQAEWALRFYPSSSDRPNRMSGYAWNLTGTPANPTNQGAGAYYQPDGGVSAIWYELVVVYDPGDWMDTQAGVSIYVNGRCQQGSRCPAVHEDPAVYYKTSPYLVYPLYGTDPLRIGTRERSTFFTGDIDEIAVFDRALDDSEIAALHTSL